MPICLGNNVLLCLHEEAPAAYKPITPVIQAQEKANLIQSVVKLKPWITFKA